MNFYNNCISCGRPNGLKIIEILKNVKEKNVSVETRTLESIGKVSDFGKLLNENKVHNTCCKNQMISIVSEITPEELDAYYNIIPISKN